MVGALHAPPIIIGHSLGGTLTRLLADVEPGGWEQVADKALSWALEHARGVSTAGGQA